MKYTGRLISDLTATVDRKLAVVHQFPAPKPRISFEDRCALLQQARAGGAGGLVGCAMIARAFIDSREIDSLRAILLQVIAEADAYLKEKAEIEKL